MDLLLYTLKRLFLAIFVLIGLSILIFVIARVVPGDPARLALGPRAPQSTVNELRREMHLDQPLAVRADVVHRCAYAVAKVHCADSIIIFAAPHR